MKTLRTALALAAFLTCFATGAAAQGAFKLGVFDPNKLLTNSKLGQSLQDDLNKFRVSKEAEIKKSGDDLEKRVAQYKAGVASMSDERREEVETELTQLRRDLERSTHDADDELTRRRQKAYKQLSEDVSQILEDYGKKNGFTVILDRSFCAFAAPSVDISDELVRLLDSRRTTP